MNDVDDSIILEPIPNPTPGRWSPEVGSETLQFLSSVVPETSQDNVRESAVSIMAKTVSPDEESGRETGLVVGYVQSGKTMSFETVAALARDNGFQVVIVIAGTATPLLDQSTQRLRRDFGLDDPGRPRRWISFKNPAPDDATLQSLRGVLDTWKDESTPAEFRKTVLITVLKHHNRLQKLTDAVREIDLHRVPILIIDDEADQASLNVRTAQNLESTTYRYLMELRKALPAHTFLQYTATPQAPLLVSIIDSLSPNFVQVLEPGTAYVGGRDFFEGSSMYVRVIPSQDVPTSKNVPTEPPGSLLTALRVFMVGVTAGIRQGGNTGNRSMMVHPSHLTMHHKEYYRWVCSIVDEWKVVLGLPSSDPDRQQLVEDFRNAHTDLLKTVGSSLPSFDELAPYLSFAFSETRVLEVNASGGHTPRIDWCGAYGWILVGGQAMDRGFTVEGLTVTYMPRGIGAGNADTVQQRARFFGYKRDYLGYCRVYLEHETLIAFQNYVQHEEDIRTQLSKFQSNGRPLDEWKRAFVLDKDLKPCRSQVLKYGFVRGEFSNKWVIPRVVLVPDDVFKANREIAETFLNDLDFEADEGDVRRTDVQRHEVARNVSLSKTMEELLVNFRVTGTADSQRNTGLLLQLEHALEKNPDEVCTIFRMSPRTGRSRGVDSNGEVIKLFQGEAPVNPPPPSRRGDIYPGDRRICDQDTVSVQIHELKLTRDQKVVAKDVVVLAVWVPSRMATGWIVQDEQP